jgi:hypothetical protein
MRPASFHQWTQSGFALIDIRVSGERANRVQCVWRRCVVAGKMWMLVAVTILNDCFYWWLVAEERYRLYPHLPDVCYRLRSTA